MGLCAPEHFGAAVPIRALVGDQQSALIGQACVAPGLVKATFGTGGFLLLNTGETPTASRNRLLTTVAYQWRGERAYALEGSIFSAGATVQWLRDGLKIIVTAAESGELAAASDPAQAVYCVPAFAGLGAPHWSSEARALLTGVTRGTTRKEIARAALESVGYQTRDLVEAMRSDAGGAIDVIRVDGGMAASDWTMQFLADILDVPGRPPEGSGIDRAGRGLRRRLAGGALSRTGVLRRKAPKGSPVYAADGRGRRATGSIGDGGTRFGGRCRVGPAGGCWSQIHRHAMLTAHTLPERTPAAIVIRNREKQRAGRAVGPSAAEDHLAEAAHRDREIDNADREHRHQRPP